MGAFARRVAPQEKTMPIEAECACGNKLYAPEHAGGKRVKGPECHASVPVAAPKLLGDDYEAVEDDPPEKAKIVASRPVRAAELEDEEEEEEKPRKKRRRKKR